MTAFSPTPLPLALRSRSGFNRLSVVRWCETADSWSDGHLVTVATPNRDRASCGQRVPFEVAVEVVYDRAGIISCGRCLRLIDRIS